MRPELVGGSDTGSAFIHLFVYLILLQCSGRLETAAEGGEEEDEEEEEKVEIKPATSLFFYTPLT